MLTSFEPSGGLTGIDHTPHLHVANLYPHPLLWLQAGALRALLDTALTPERPASAAAGRGGASGGGADGGSPVKVGEGMTPACAACFPFRTAYAPWLFIRCSNQLCVCTDVVSNLCDHPTDCAVQPALPCMPGKHMFCSFPLLQTQRRASSETKHTPLRCLTLTCTLDSADRAVQPGQHVRAQGVPRGPAGSQHLGRHPQVCGWLLWVVAAGCAAGAAVVCAGTRLVIAPAC